MSIYFLKKLIAAVVMPLPVALMLILAGVLLLALKRRRAGGLLVCAAALGVFLASWSPIADTLLGNLENRHLPILDGSSHPDAVAVVVLGGGCNPDPALPITSQLNSPSLFRIIEGVRLYRQLPGVRLVLSGGPAVGSGATAHGYARIAEALGVPASDMIILDGPKDTADEARAVRELLGADKAFLLVTSASHMPRAVLHFHRAGLRPIPAPTDHKSLKEVSKGASYWIPSGSQLQVTEQALHEYLGILAMGLDYIGHQNISGN